MIYHKRYHSWKNDTLWVVTKEKKLSLSEDIIHLVPRARVRFWPSNTLLRCRLFHSGVQMFYFLFLLLLFPSFIKRGLQWMMLDIDGIHYQHWSYLRSVIGGVISKNEVVFKSEKRDCDCMCAIQLWVSWHDQV